MAGFRKYGPWAGGVRATLGRRRGDESGIFCIFDTILILGCGGVTSAALLGRGFFGRCGSRILRGWVSVFQENPGLEFCGSLRAETASYVAKPPRRAACDKAFL